MDTGSPRQIGNQYQFNKAFAKRFRRDITKLKESDAYSISSDTTSVRLEKKR